MNRGWAPLTGLARGRFKLIDLPLPELYDLDLDPRETRNLAASQPQVFESLRAPLASMRAGERGGRPRVHAARLRVRCRRAGARRSDRLFVLCDGHGASPPYAP